MNTRLAAIDQSLDTTVTGENRLNLQTKERVVHMNGNQEMGGLAWAYSKTGPISSSTAALSEVIYVGRASFRVALEVEAPPPAADTTPWFHPVEGDEQLPVVLSSGPGGIATPARLSEPSDTDGVPILYDSEVVRNVPSRQRTSRWTIGLPLAFGGFFCGILTSPLVSPARARHERASEAEAAPPSRAMSAPVVAPVPVAPVPVAPTVAPIVAPIVASTVPPEPTAPPVTVLTETLTTTGAKPGMPVQGRGSASEKRAPHKVVPRHAGRISSSLASAPTTDTWIDPWADN